MAEGLVEAFRALDLHAEPRLTKVDSFDSAALVGTENDRRDRSFEIRSLKAAVTIPGSQRSTPSSLGSKIPCEAGRPSKLEFQGHAASWENPSIPRYSPAGSRCWYREIWHTALERPVESLPRSWRRSPPPEERSPRMSAGSLHRMGKSSFASFSPTRSRPLRSGWPTRFRSAASA